MSGKQQKSLLCSNTVKARPYSRANGPVETVFEELGITLGAN